MDFVDSAEHHCGGVTEQQDLNAEVAENSLQDNHTSGDGTMPASELVDLPKDVGGAGTGGASTGGAAGAANVGGVNIGVVATEGTETAEPQAEAADGPVIIIEAIGGNSRGAWSRSGKGRGGAGYMCPTMGNVHLSEASKNETRAEGRSTSPDAEYFNVQY